MMESPLFSIITITFQAEATLPATLQSVECQTFTDYEYLVVDGASTDGTVALARASWAVTSVTSEPDRGLYDAMNKGPSFACRLVWMVSLRSAATLYHSLLFLNREPGGARLFSGGKMWYAGRKPNGKDEKRR